MANIDIGGRLHSTATGNVVAGANEIFDDNEQKKQSQINAELINAQEELEESIQEGIDALSEEIATKQGTITATVAGEIGDDGGTPEAEVDFENGKLAFAFKNLKLRFSDLTNADKEALRGPTGNTAVFDPDSPDLAMFEMTNETGKSTTKAMTQRAITEQLNSIGDDIYDYEPLGETEVDLSSQINIPASNINRFVLWEGNGLSAATSYDSSDYIDIEEYDTIQYSRAATSSSAAVFGIAFYNKSKSNVGGQSVLTSVSNPSAYTPTRIDVPPGAKYMRMSIRHAEDNWGDPVLIGYKKTYTKTPKFETMAQDIEANVNATEEVSRAVFDYEKTDSEVMADLSSKITHYKASYNVLTNGNLSGGSSINDVTNFIDIEGYDGIRYSRNSRSSTTNIGIAFYASDKTTCLGGQSAIYNSAATDYVITDRDVPVGAKYVRMTIRKTTQNWSTPVLYGLKYIYTKTPKIPAIEERIEAIEEAMPSVGESIFPPLIGVPQIYTTEVTENIPARPTTIAALYDAYDSLVAQFPGWLKKESDLGVDASGNYQVRHYTLRYQTPLISPNRSGSGTNEWSDEGFPMRRILLLTGSHPAEYSSVYGTYLAIKAICESDEPWAKYIKANAVIDIIPIINPWGYENASNYNVNGININRDYKAATKQIETQHVIDLITELKTKNLGGVLDMHNTGDGDCYIVSNSAYKEYKYYARLAQQFNVIMREPLNTLFGSTGNHMHLWRTEETGQSHWYADQNGLLGMTMETKVISGKLLRCAIITSIQAVNAIIAFIQKIK